MNFEDVLTFVRDLIIDTALRVLNVIKWFRLKYFGCELVPANALSLNK
jgi:hypothetical protein